MGRREGSEPERQESTFYSAYLQLKRISRDRPLTAEGLPMGLELSMDGFTLPFRMPVRDGRLFAGMVLGALLAGGAVILLLVWTLTQMLEAGGVVTFGVATPAAPVCPMLIGAVGGLAPMVIVERLRPGAVLELSGTRVSLRVGKSVLADAAIPSSGTVLDVEVQGFTDKRGVRQAMLVVKRVYGPPIVTEVEITPTGVRMQDRRVEAGDTLEVQAVDPASVDEEGNGLVVVRTEGELDASSLKEGERYLYIHPGDWFERSHALVRRVRRAR